MRTLQPPPRPLGHELLLAGEYAGNLAVMWPVLVLLPAALIGTRPLQRVAVVLALLLAWLPAQIQQQFFLYHAAAVPVVAAVVVVVALRQGAATMWVLVIALTGWTAWLMSAPYPWRADRYLWWFAVTGIIGVAAWALQRRALHALEGSTRDRTSVGLITATLLTILFLSTSARQRRSRCRSATLSAGRRC
jgi:hypothetical protein